MKKLFLSKLVFLILIFPFLVFAQQQTVLTPDRSMKLMQALDRTGSTFISLMGEYMVQSLKCDFEQGVPSGPMMKYSRNVDGWPYGKPIEGVEGIIALGTVLFNEYRCSYNYSYWAGQNAAFLLDQDVTRPKTPTVSLRPATSLYNDLIQLGFRSYCNGGNKCTITINDIRCRASTRSCRVVIP